MMAHRIRALWLLAGGCLLAALVCGLGWLRAAAERDALAANPAPREALGELERAEERNRELLRELDRTRAALDAATERAQGLTEELAARKERIEALSALAQPERERREIEANSGVTAGRYSSAAADFPYLLYTPGLEGEGLPLIVYLHGTGGRGTDPERIYSEDSLPNFLRDGLLRPKALVLMPQCPEGSNWFERREGLMELIRAIAAERGADLHRVSVTGFSMGGIGCFALLTGWPEFFSAAAPFAATFSPAACAVITSTPVRMLHGSADEGMGFDVVEINRIIRQAGGQSELRLLSGEGHTIQGHYLDDNGAILDWLAAQRRT